jgi:hypothetical protein
MNKEAGFGVYTKSMLEELKVIDVGKGEASFQMKDGLERKRLCLK